MQPNTNKGAGPGSLLRIDLATNEIVAEIPLAGHAWRGRVAATANAVWVGSGSMVERIDPSTNAVVAQVAIPNRFVSALAADEEAAWVVGISDGADSGEQSVGVLLRIDPSTNDVVAEISLSKVTGYEDQLAIGAGAVWVLGRKLVAEDAEDGGDLIRIDSATNSIAASLPVDAFSMVVGGDEVWIHFPEDGLFDGSHERWRWRIVDARTNAVGEPFAFEDGGVAFVSPEALWSVGYDEHDHVAVKRSDPRSLDPVEEATVTRTYYTDSVVDQTTRTVWVASLWDGVIRIDIV